MDAALDLAQLIADWAARISVSGKTGKRLLQPSLAGAFRAAGFTADEEDQAQLLKPGMPVWRSKDDDMVEPTTQRRRVDIIVYRNSHLVAMIETESDLNDLRVSGVTRRNGHYDVASIAWSAGGSHFDSYKSIERMAAAAFYWNFSRTSGRYPSADEAVILLEAIRSDEPVRHNPGGVALYLVSGSCRSQDSDILAPRLKSLGAHLVCVTAA